MSISKVIVQFSTLPSLFKQELINLIQRQVSTSQELKLILISHNFDFPPCKAMPIVKQQYFKNLIKKQFVQQSIVNLYFFMTEKAYTIEEKTHVSNLVYKLIYLISEISMTKEKWKLIFNRQVDNLAQRFRFPEQENSHQNYLPAVLTVHQAETLKDYINKEIFAFYEIWEKLLEQNQNLVIDSQPFEPVKSQSKGPNLSQGKKLQINEILALNFLKEYLSDKPPVQEKKDPKKK